MGFLTVARESRPWDLEMARVSRGILKVARACRPWALKVDGRLARGITRKMRVPPRQYEAVIPAAGFGTRMLPTHERRPERVVPVGGKPMIQHIIEKRLQSVSRASALSSARGKESIRDCLEELTTSASYPSFISTNTWD